MNNKLNTCDTGNHKLIEIYRRDYLMSSHVIRWCEDCGAVVGDEDFDGRTNAGSLFKMIFPKIPYIKS